MADASISSRTSRGRTQGALPFLDHRPSRLEEEADEGSGNHRLYVADDSNAISDSEEDVCGLSSASTDDSLDSNYACYSEVSAGGSTGCCAPSSFTASSPLLTAATGAHQPGIAAWTCAVNPPGETTPLVTYATAEAEAEADLELAVASASGIDGAAAIAVIASNSDSSVTASDTDTQYDVAAKPGTPPSSVMFRMLLLLLLAWQTTIVTLTVRLSRGVRHETYAISASIVCSEAIKALLAAVLVCRQCDWCVRGGLQRLAHNVLHSLPMAVPAALFLAQNKLNYVALQRLDGSTYSILIQLKLLTTAVFAVAFLRKRLYAYQWRALLMLFIGVVLVQRGGSSSSAAAATVPTTTAAGQCDVSAAVSLSGIGSCLLFLLDSHAGAMAAVGQAVLSGLSGVYFEWQLKRSAAVSLWERNVQLSVFGVLFALLSLLVSADEYALVAADWFFHGFSALTWLVVLLNSCGGLLIAVCVQYTDNIVKNFATSIAILFTAAASHVLFHDVSLSVTFACGTLTVLLAVSMYNENIAALARLMEQDTRSDSEQARAVLRSVVRLKKQLDDL